LIPRPALAVIRVAPTASPPVRRYHAPATRGTVALPKLALRSNRTPAVTNARDHSAWCWNVTPTLSRDAGTDVPARASRSVARSPSQSTRAVSTCVPARDVETVPSTW
jgi:hypothetical protein